MQGSKAPWNSPKLLLHRHPKLILPPIQRPLPTALLVRTNIQPPQPRPRPCRRTLPNLALIPVRTGHRAPLHPPLHQFLPVRPRHAPPEGNPALTRPRHQQRSPRHAPALRSYRPTPLLSRHGVVSVHLLRISSRLRLHPRLPLPPLHRSRNVWKSCSPSPPVSLLVSPPSPIVSSGRRCAASAVASTTTTMTVRSHATSPTLSWRYDRSFGIFSVSRTAANPFSPAK